MSQSQRQRKNRQKAAGSSAPAPDEAMHTLRKLFLYPHSPKVLVVILILWLSNRLRHYTREKAPPEFYRLRSSDPVGPNTLRTVSFGAISWMEFSLPLPHSKLYSLDGVEQTLTKPLWIWLPIPIAFNKQFRSVLTEHKNYDKPFLNNKEYKELQAWFQSRYKTMNKLSSKRLMHHTSFLYYFHHRACSAPLLPAHAKYALLHDALPHRASITYQKITVNALRWQLDQFYNHSIKALMTSAENHHCLSDLTFHHGRLPDRHDNVPSYMIKPDRTMCCYQKQALTHSKQATEIPNQLLQGSRCVEIKEIKRSFTILEDKLMTLTPTKYATRSEHRAYYNFMTYLLALQTIFLTSMRPTHKISPSEWPLSSSLCSIKDKGRLRYLVICPFLNKQYQHYQKIQHALLPPRSQQTKSGSPILLLMDDNDGIQSLSAYSLRSFLKENAISFVPYQFRHACAQMLSTLNTPTHLLDNIMGHYNDGEEFDIIGSSKSDQECMVAKLEELAITMQLRPWL